MVITYFGKQFFKVQQGEMVLAFNPVSKDSKIGPYARFGADIALITVNHPNYSGREQLSFGDREPFVISGPGSYEVREIFIKGVMAKGEIDGKKYINTIYLLKLDGMDIVFLGALANSEMEKEAREAIEEPDILFVPVGGKDTLGAKEAAKLVSSLEPRLVIPMDYDAASLKAFLKEMGEEKAEVVDKLTLKKKDLERKESEVVVLKAI